MARTAAETAGILSDLYGKQFGRDFSEPFRITWAQLRTLTGAAGGLRERYLQEIDEALLENEYRLIPFNSYLVVMLDNELAGFRKLPGRLLERCLIDLEDIELDDEYENELDETEETDDCEDRDLDDDQDDAEDRG
jgi:hypothetical protein